MAAPCVQRGLRVNDIHAGGVQSFAVSFQLHNEKKLLKFQNETKFFTKKLIRNEAKQNFEIFSFRTPQVVSITFLPDVSVPLNNGNNA